MTFLTRMTRLGRVSSVAIGVSILAALPAGAQFGGSSTSGGSSGGSSGFGNSGSSGNSGGSGTFGGNGGSSRGSFGTGGATDFGVGASADYELQPGDLVRIEMFGQAEVSTAQRLTANGELRLPLVGRVTLDKLTVRDAELKIERLYRQGGYYIDPQIVLYVQQYSESFVSIFGQVRNPSRIPFPPEAKEIGILQAITLAGGFTRIAKTDAVQVSRTNSEGTEERLEVNVEKILRARRPGEEREFQLLPGDLVFVPERIF